jgi:hypothetical protein
MIVTVSVFSASPAAAQGLAQKLEAVKAISCTFTAQAVGNWSGGTIKADVRTPKLAVQFVEIDTSDGSASAKGEFGASPILVRYANGTLHFMQSFLTGPLYVTTVFARETQPGKLMAVHTRHEFAAIALPGTTSRPEQYYGECELGSS